MDNTKTPEFSGEIERALDWAACLHPDGQWTMLVHILAKEVRRKIREDMPSTTLVDLEARAGVYRSIADEIRGKGGMGISLEKVEAWAAIAEADAQRLREAITKSEDEVTHGGN